MNTEISYGSPEEDMSLALRNGDRELEFLIGRKFFDDVMEKYDPGGRRAHEIAKKYYPEEEKNG